MIDLKTLNRVTHVCSHPVHMVINGQSYSLPCRKCEACRQNKAGRYSHLIQLESQFWQYTYFITLTFDNDNLPTMYVSDSRRIICHDGHYRTQYDYRDSKTDDLVTSSHYDKVSMLQRKVSLDGVFPYLSKRPLQLFFKRFKKYVKSIPTSGGDNASYSYFACGEYGPVHFRPHYHILLHCTQPVMWHLKDLLNKAWKFGRIDFSLSKGKASNYVSRYCVSPSTLPALYQTKETKPFFVHSIFYGFSNLTSNPLKIISNPELYIKHRIFLDNPLDISSWASFSRAFFPKVPQFDFLFRNSLQDLYKIYSLYPLAIQKFGQAPVTILTKLIISDYLQGSDYSLLTGYGIHINDSSISNILYISKRVFRIISRYNLTLMYYVQQINFYYTLSNYTQLVEWYQNRSLLDNDSQYLCYDSSYDDFVDVNGFYLQVCEIPYIYKDELDSLRDWLVSKCNKTIKHKYQNDLNQLFL